MKSLQKIVPIKLSKILETGEFEDDGGLLITGLDYFADDLKVEFIVNPGDLEADSKNNQLWELQIGNLKREKLEISWSSEIELHNDHFLIWDFTKSWTKLYFNGNARNADRFLSEIYQIHRRKFGRWIEVEKYLNVQPDLYGLCRSKYGLFAEGPKEILVAYEDCLRSHNMNPHFQGDYKGLNSHNREPLLQLLIFGESYFIAEKFEFTPA